MSIRASFLLPIVRCCVLRHYIILLFVAITWLGRQSAQAQLQAAHWYFGDQAGLDFRAELPVALTNGALRSDEGCSSRADSVGNLLFYTNGSTVWNRQHQVMVGGNLLFGNVSATQHLIVAQPGTSRRYYVFTLPATTVPSAGFGYSVVDMSRQAGLGEVIQRNVLVYSDASERVAAVPHANHRDIWIITHKINSALFQVYLLTATGLSTTPVSSAGGFVHEQGRLGGIGQLKASPNGRQLAVAAGTSQGGSVANSVELLSFDDRSGRITAPLVLPPPGGLNSYGVEFSPDGTRLYVSDIAQSTLWQYDLRSPTIAASAQRVPIPGPSGGLGISQKAALQLGPDGRIYVAHPPFPYPEYLGVITDPNQPAATCNYQDVGVSLAGRRSSLGLPTFMQRDLWHFTIKGTCQGEIISFAFPATYSPDSVRWDFGDSTSGVNNTSRLLAPTHRYLVPGQYKIELTLFYADGYQPVLRRFVQIQPKPVITLGRDTALCPGNRLTLDATFPGATYRWQDNSKAATLIATQPGVYWVDVTSAAGCTIRDSLRIRSAPLPQIQLGVDTVVCVGQVLRLSPRSAGVGVRYRWSDGSTAASLTVSQAGTYWLEGTNAAGCSQRDSVRVYYLTPPTIYLGRDTALCQTPDTPFTLDATLPGVRYRWSDGSTNATLTLLRSGTYWVTVSTAFCSATDTIRVNLYDCRQAVFVPNIITPNGDGKNDALKIIGLDQGAWTLRIYNRWGREVYQTSAYEQDWIAAGLANGVYFYWLRERKTGQLVKGWLEVVR